MHSRSSDGRSNNEDFHKENVGLITNAKIAIGDLGALHVISHLQSCVKKRRKNAFSRMKIAQDCVGASCSVHLQNTDEC